MTAFEEFVARVEQVTGRPGKRQGRNVKLLCPGHEDATPSLDVAEADDGRPLVQCRSHRCSWETIADAVGWERSRGSGRLIVAEYDYTDQTGLLLYQVVRYEPKDFRQRQPDGAGGWVYNLRGVDRALYRLPSVIEAAGRGELVFVVEGEKDADALARLGLVATTGAMGAGKWRDEYTAQLKGARVVAIPDDDDEGRRHAGQVVDALRRAGVEAAVLDLASEPGSTKADVSDWLAHARNEEERRQAARSLVEMAEAVLAHSSSPTVAVHSWRPVDVVEAAANPPAPPAILGLLYRDRRHSITGPQESAKGWVNLIAAAEEIRAGRCVAWVDLETTAAELHERLRALGITDDEIRDRFVYLQPEEPVTDPAILGDVVRLVEERQPTLVVLDAITGLMGLHGLDPNSAVDVERFYRTVVQPLRASGAAISAIDHVVKDETKRGRYATGSARKVEIADVHLGLEVIVPFGRGRIGRYKVLTHKDRPGYLPRPKAAELELRSDADTGYVSWSLVKAADDAGGSWRPTRLMEKASRYIEAQTEPVPVGQVVEQVVGKAEHLRAAVSVLVEEGYVREEQGRGLARLLTSVRPFREADEEGRKQ